MNQQRGFDTSIPVLTELFVDKPEPSGPLLQDDTNAHLEARALDGWTEPEWTLLERRLSERILQQLQGRVDFVLEQRLRDSLEEVVQGAMTALTAEIRQGLQQTIEKIVVRAISQELAHLQTLKK